MSFRTRRPLRIQEGRPLEEQVQQSIILRLRSQGYIVKQTTVRVKRRQCQSCQTWSTPPGDTGQDKGIPDLLVSHRDWPLGTWFGIEVKRPSWKPSEVRTEQKEMVANARYFVAASPDEAEALVAYFERYHGISSNITGDSMDGEDEALRQIPLFGGEVQPVWFNEGEAHKNPASPPREARLGPKDDFYDVT